MIDLAPKRRWTLLSSNYCRTETLRNLSKLNSEAANVFLETIAPNVRFTADRVVSDNPLVLPVTKDRPVVITALAEKSDVLLTLDRRDFHDRLGTQIYGMLIRTPGDWLTEILAR